MLNNSHLPRAPRRSGQWAKAALQASPAQSVEFPLETFAFSRTTATGSATLFRSTAKLLEAYYAAIAGLERAEAAA
jgi:hypothetical protein